MSKRAAMNALDLARTEIAEMTQRLIKLRKELVDARATIVRQRARIEALTNEEILD